MLISICFTTTALQIKQSIWVSSILSAYLVRNKLLREDKEQLQLNVNR